MAAPEEAELVARLRRRDEAAFRELVSLYHGRLVRLARTFVRDAAAAEEVAQEAWLGVVRGIGRFEGRGSLRAWLFTILANRARTRAERDGRSVAFTSLDAAELADSELFDAKGYWRKDPGPWRTLDPGEIALSAELGARVREAIDALPERSRAVVILRDLEQLSSEEVCAALEISEANQRVLLHRGRVAVRAALEKYLGG